MLGGFGFYGNIESGNYNPINKISGVQENKLLQNESWVLLKSLSNDANYGVAKNKFDNTQWVNIASQKKRLILVGNSYSKDLYNVLVNSRLVINDFEITRFGAQIRKLNDSHAFWKSPNYNVSDVVVIVSRYTEKDIIELPYVIQRAKSEGKVVVIVKNIFEFPEYHAGSLSLIDVAKFRFGNDAHRINREYYKVFSKSKMPSGIKDLNLRIDAIAKDNNSIVLDRTDYVCRLSDSVCDAVNSNGGKFFYDYGHHTLLGAEFFGRRVDETKWFSKVIDKNNLK